MKKKKKYNNDGKIISRAQDNEDKNLDTIPTSDDNIKLKTPAMQGEESISGDAPDPDSDDDVLLNAHAVGEQLDEDLEHPKELNIASDVNRAEKEILES